MDQRHYFPLRNQLPQFHNENRFPIPPPLGNPAFQQNFMENCNTLRFNPNMTGPPHPSNQFVNIMPPRGPHSNMNHAVNIMPPSPFLPMPDMIQPPPFSAPWQQAMRRSPADLPKPPLPPFSCPNSSPRPWMRTPSQHPLDASSSFSDIRPPVKDSDEMLIEQFLDKIGKLNNQRTKPTKPDKSKGQSEKKYLKICEAKKMQTRARRLVADLEDLSCNCEENLKEISECKDELQEILSILSNDDIIADLQNKLSQRRKKRHRIRLLKHKAFQVKVEREKKIDETHKNIAEWQEKEKARLDTQRREEEMQKQLDEALFELRKELNSVTKSLDIINAVATLRKIRLNSLKSRGQDPPTQSSTNHYSNAARTAKESLQDYKDSCLSKITSLKKFVEAGQTQAKVELEKEKRKKMIEKQKKIDDERNAILFGNHVELDAFDPLWPVQQLHKQAEINLPNFVQCRRMWDHFINGEGSSIPVDWVFPSPPSSEVWAKYLNTSRCAERKEKS